MLARNHGGVRRFIALAAAAMLTATHPALACDLIIGPDFCESDWRTNPEFWAGDWTGYASQSHHVYDTVPAVWQPDPMGDVSIFPAGEAFDALYIVTPAPIKILARPVGPDNAAYQRALEKYGESWPNHFVAELGKSKLVYLEGAEATLTAMRACDGAAGAWFAPVETVDGMPMEMFLLAANPITIYAHLRADAQFRGADVKVSQFLQFKRDSPPDGFRVVATTREECAAACAAEPWRCLAGQFTGE